MNREQISALRHHFYGHTDVPGRAALEEGWRAVKAIAGGKRGLGEAGRQCLLARMSAIATPAEVVEHVLDWNERSARLEPLLQKIPVPDEVRWRTEAWILYEAMSVALADRDLTADEIEALRELGARVEVSADTVDALAELCREEAALRRRRVDLLASQSAASFHVELL